MSKLRELLDDLSQPPVNQDAAFTWGDMQWIMERIKKAVDADTEGTDLPSLDSEATSRQAEAQSGAGEKGRL